MAEATKTVLDKLGPLQVEVFTTGMIAKMCKVAPKTVSDWFNDGRLKGYRIPGSQDRRIPREHLVRFLKEQYGDQGLEWLEAWEKEHALKRLVLARSPVLVFGAHAASELPPVLLEAASRILKDAKFKAHVLPGGSFECGLAFVECSYCRAVAVIVLAGEKFPTGFPAPKTLSATITQHKRPRSGRRRPPTITATKDQLVFYVAPLPKAAKANVRARRQLGETVDTHPSAQRRLRKLLKCPAQIFDLSGEADV